jgi:hypothetical protein
MHWLLTDGGAKIYETEDDGSTVWSLLELEGAEPTTLSSLLKVMLLKRDAPENFVAKLSPTHVELVTRGTNTVLTLY